MRVLVSLIGGQLLPVYLGIKELKPEKIVFLSSSDSKQRLSGLRNILANYSPFEYECDPFDFESVKQRCEYIIDKFTGDEITFNLTGGTKIMVLAVQSIIQDKNLAGIYINQDDTMLVIPAYRKLPIKYDLTISEFFKLSNHSASGFELFANVQNRDLMTAHQIASFATEGNKYSAITKHFRNRYKDLTSLPESGQERLQNGIEIKWTIDSIHADQNGRQVCHFKGANVKSLFFNTAWWELLVAEELNKWSGSTELYLNCELPYKTDENEMKNEIDILLNTGKKLVFVECKSGKVVQADINKMNSIKKTYGGAISKSLLVSRYLPSTTIVEKCKELDIEIYAASALRNQPPTLKNLNNQIIKILKRSSL